MSAYVYDIFKQMITMLADVASIKTDVDAIATDAGELNWALASLADETADDSDKTFTVPAATQYQILWIWVELTTTATAGNRQLCIEIQDAAGDVIAQAARVGTVQTASLTRNYLFAPAAADLLAFRDTDYITTPIPPTLFLSAGQKIRVYDKSAVAAAADDMIVQMQVATRSV